MVLPTNDERDIMTRDAYQSRTYEAENELRFIADTEVTTYDFYGSTLVLPEPRKFGDLAGVQRFVDAVCALPAVYERYPTPPWRPAPRAIPYGGVMKATYRAMDNVIRIPQHQGSKSSWAMTEFVVLHEIAHYLCHGREGDTGAHGTEFCVCFMFLLETVLGGGWHILLMHALDKRGVPLHAGCNS